MPERKLSLEDKREMVRLKVLGRSIPQIAAVFKITPQYVRRILKPADEWNEHIYDGCWFCGVEPLVEFDFWCDGECEKKWNDASAHWFATGDKSRMRQLHSTLVDRERHAARNSETGK